MITVWTLPHWVELWKKIETITPITRTINDQKCLYNFKKELEKHINHYSIGPELATTYCQYQLARLLNYEEKKTYSGKITCPMMFGEQALKYFLGRDVNGGWRFHHSRSQITTDIVKRWVNWPSENTVADGMNMVELAVHRKALELSETRRIEYCLQFSSLYKENDASCLRCSVLKACKTTQQRFLPQTKPKSGQKKKLLSSQ